MFLFCKTRTYSTCTMMYTLGEKDNFCKLLPRPCSRGGQFWCPVILLLILVFLFMWCTVRSGAEERTFWGARLDVLIFRLRSYHVLITYGAECNGPKFYKTPMFLGQSGMFLSFQARRSSATRSSTSDISLYCWLYLLFLVQLYCQRCCFFLCL